MNQKEPNPYYIKQWHIRWTLLIIFIIWHTPIAFIDFITWKKTMIRVPITGTNYSYKTYEKRWLFRKFDELKENEINVSFISIAYVFFLGTLIGTTFGLLIASMIVGYSS